MPDLSLRGRRLPELRLPEMSREDISRALGDARRDVDLSRMDPRRIELPEVDLSKVELPKIDLSKVELPKSVTKAARSAGLIRQPRRSRLPVVIVGLVVAGVLAWIVANAATIRPRVQEVAQRARGAMQARRESMHDETAYDSNESRAFDAAVAVPIQPSAYAGATDPVDSPYDGSASLPDGFGATVDHQAPAATTYDTETPASGSPFGEVATSDESPRV